MSDIKEAKKTCKDVLISDLTRNRLLHQEEGLTTIQGLDIDLSWFKLKPEQWIRILEQVVKLKFNYISSSQYNIEANNTLEFD